MPKYKTFVVDQHVDHVALHDHLGGFDSDLRCEALDRLATQTAGQKITVETEYIVDQRIRDNYPNFDFVFSVPVHNAVLDHFKDYTIHPELTFENFLCSFNGVPHVSRKLLVAILHKFKLFDPRYSSKNFSFTDDIISGHVKDYVGQREFFYNKFFLSDDQEFCNAIYSFGHERYDHANNIYTLEKQLTGSFVHVVSDTIATSYYPFFGEKFLYSVVTRGLFLSYAQPGWHTYLEKYYGFKNYHMLFDYKFDSIANPVERLLELITMLDKFTKLSSDDWRDLYLLEADTIEYNYDHYFSGAYLDCLNKC